jgi:hypothetical protein
MSSENSLLKQLSSLLSYKKSKAFYAQKLGITVGEVDELLAELKQNKAVSAEDEILNETWVAKRTSENVEFNQLIEQKVTNEGKELELKSLWSSEPKSPEEIEKAHNIDKTKWKLSSYWSKLGKDGMWTVSAYFKATEIDSNLEMQKSVILDEIKAHTTQSLDRPYIIYRPQASIEDLLLEICVFDPHFGKLAWEDEGTDNYDLDIAEKRFKEAVNELLGRVDLTKVRRIHFPVGNDLFHIDNDANTTTHGTSMHSDSRFPKLVQRIRKILVETIDIISTIAPVDVTVVPGNHDTQSCFMMGEIIDAWYHNDSRIFINNSPRSRKYYQYGVNGFMYCHGHNEKWGDFIKLFAAQEPQLWAETKFRWAKIGHLHHNKKMEYWSQEDDHAFQVQVIPSISSDDKWHFDKGYHSLKQAKAFLYHKEKGEIANYNHNSV